MIAILRALGLRFGLSLGLSLGLLLASAVAAPAWAQAAAAEPTPAEWLAKIQADKKGIVAKSMNLTPDEAKKFWPLYDAFQRELDVPQREFTLAVLDYVRAENSLTDANAKRIAEQMLAARLKEAQLHQKHFKQLLKVLPARKAARYLQIESKMHAVAQYEAAKVIPLVQ
jgi:Spy/CpxP family protein refolding chaperone